MSNKKCKNYNEIQIAYNKAEKNVEDANGQVVDVEISGGVAVTGVVCAVAGCAAGGPLVCALALIAIGGAGAGSIPLNRALLKANSNLQKANEQFQKAKTALCDCKAGKDVAVPVIGDIEKIDTSSTNADTQSNECDYSDEEDGGMDFTLDDLENFDDDENPEDDISVTWGDPSISDVQ